jgi:hypothetical protein
MRSVFIGDSLKLKFAPQLDCSLLLKSCVVLAGEGNTLALAEAVGLAKKTSP